MNTHKYVQALTESEAKFIDDIVQQIPETFGAREVFVGLLNKLASYEAPRKFEYLVIDTENDTVYGSSDEDESEAAYHEYHYLIVNLKDMTTPIGPITEFYE